MSEHLPLVKFNNIKSKNKDIRQIHKYRFIHNFLPHTEHKTRARLVSSRAFFTYSLLMIAGIALFNFIPKAIPGVLGYASNITIRDLFTYTNNRRVDSGLEKLRINLSLSRAAEKKAKDMFQENYWAHISPEGVEPWDFIIGEDYEYLYAGENLAKNFYHSKDVVDAWYDSPSHKANLLSANYDEVGFAVVNGVLNGYETTLVVQMFGRPKNPEYLAGRYDENTILSLLDSKLLTNVPSDTDSSKPKSAAVVVEPILKEAPPVKSLLKVQTPVDTPHIVKYIALLFGCFINLLLLLDIWYSRHKGIVKFTGHTFAHLVLLILSLLGVWLALAPGKVL